MNAQPLDGITVLDFGQVYNGPYCGFLLAQAGARVIKVESLIGETLRARGETSAASYAFSLLNANKESITLNIKSAEAQALVKQLAREVDVVFENFAPGTMAKYGIGAEALRRETLHLQLSLEASDRDRQMIAYEIHDGLAQQLAAASMQFQTYTHLREHEPENAKTAYDAGVQLVRQAVPPPSQL